MKDIDTYNFSGKRALIRVDFNVPLDGETLEVMDDTRIRAAVPTIQKVIAGGGSVVLMSHLGRPKAAYETRYSLRHLLKTIEQHLATRIQFASDCIGEDAFQQSRQLARGEVLLLENLRFHEGEKKGSPEMAQQLARHGDVYVNDAFGTAHRAHASTAVIARYFPEDKLFGYLIKREMHVVDKRIKAADQPLTAIVGGAKVSSKIGMLHTLLPTVDQLLIGGGMAYTFVKAMGGQVGSSLVEDDFLETAQSILEAARSKQVQLVLPTDGLIADSFSNEAAVREAPIDAIPDGWMGLDIGPASIAQFRQLILNAKCLLWNGPMGVFEMPSFQKGTEAIAAAVAEATQRGAYSIVGGGDSAAAVNQFGLESQISHLSTGGGAMLAYLEGKTLPGIAAISPT